MNPSTIATIREARIAASLKTTRAGLIALMKLRNGKRPGGMVISGLKARGFVDDAGRITDAGLRVLDKARRMGF